MADTGWLFAGAGASTASWTNPGNITSDNGSAATASWAAFGNTDYLRCTNFGVSLPAGAGITGISVRMDKQATTTGSFHLSLYLTKNGTSTAGYEKSFALSTGLEEKGWLGNLWGTTWTKAEVEATTFGCLITGLDDLGYSGGSAAIDYVQIKVHYNTSLYSSVIIGESL